jgi:hypothetical protein
MTLFQWARELDLHHETLGKALVAIGKEVKRGARFNTRVIFRAVKSDLEYERILEIRERRKVIELQRAQMEAGLVDIESVTQMVTTALSVVERFMRSVPAAAAARCNPADPHLARAALENIVSAALPQLRFLPPKSRSGDQFRRGSEIDPGCCAAGPIDPG